MFRSLVGHFFKTSHPTLDNLVFRLHYRVTVGLLIACAAALLWKINYGKPIICVSTDDNSRYLDDHCWYDGTFTIPSSRNKAVGIEVPARGISGDIRSGVEYHNIHRWVIIAVLVQAVFFYLPRMIWKLVEGRLVQRLMWNLNNPKKNSSVDMFRKEMITNYFRRSSFRNLLYAGGHLICELMNLFNVVVQLFLVSHVLQMSFPSVGLFVTSRSERLDASALSSFPLTTKCRVFKYSSRGDVQRDDASCLMSINGVMESVFIYQWIWFALLAVLSVLAVLYRVVMLVLPPFRTLRLSSKANLSNRSTMNQVVRRLGLGDCFVLYMISKNIDPVHTRDILESLAETPDKTIQLRPLSNTQLLI